MAGSSDRGQAYTLEALIAALLLVTAVLFALQSVVITPTSAGTQDQDVQAQQLQVADDLLATAANDGELSRLARFWDCSSGTFAQDSDSGDWIATEGYPADTVPVEDFGSALNQTFDVSGRYNLELVYENDGNQNVTRIVYQGTPTAEVVSTSYVVTLTDDQAVTGRQNGDETLESCPTPAIPAMDTDSDSSIYNVVEVRLVLW